MIYEGSKMNTKILNFVCLGRKDVIAKQISDHYPIMHNGVFFWNIMMQGKKRAGGAGYNNGFGFVETEAQYRKRLGIIAQVIAEAVLRNPDIEVISLCEGPIKPEHVRLLLQALKQFPCMARFIEKNHFHTPDSNGPHWGLLMLADARYTVEKSPSVSLKDYPRLTNRFQLWTLKHNNIKKYVALAHFPFAGDEYKAEKMALSASGQKYCSLIHTVMKLHHKKNLIFCADFNFNPYLINQWQDRACDKIPHNNSILLTEESLYHKTVTVDGILLSFREKQKYYFLHQSASFYGKLKAEYRFFQAHIKHVFSEVKHSEQNRQWGLSSQEVCL